MFHVSAMFHPMVVTEQGNIALVFKGVGKKILKVAL